MSASNIITSLYPCYIGQFLIGCAPIKILEIRNNLQISNRRIYDYFTILILFLIILFIYHRYSLMNFYDFDSSALVKFMTTVYFIIVSGLISTNVIYSRVQRQEKTENMLVCKPFYRQVSLIEVMKLHQEIYDLLQLANRIFAAQILFSFTVGFVIITFQSFSIICAVYNNSPYLKYSIASAIWIILIVTEKMALTFSCHKFD
ncbi:uncharacterized protein LOC123010146 [Tribolium madens]|uniref:uncharacterized protein LOC123010146 n=1 Tax=Tribolium madens TaxID=41895 RepID=UPI001CF72DEF|nr:uncharacterized protein LOC123010146 [Tribolium madens]